jgi:SAM-dependent methyltransferase
VTYAGAEFWDQFFRRRRESGDDLDWQGRWTEPFLAPLREAGARTILELGCGTGNDAARLAAAGFSVTAVDLSGEAIDQARARYGAMVTFAEADIARRLPFPDGGFDALMSNVAMHMFPDRVTRAVFAEVGRLDCSCFTSTPSRTGRCARFGCLHANWNPTTWSRSPARRCTSSPRLTCAISSGNGRSCAWTRSRSCTARRVSYTSTSGGA